MILQSTPIMNFQASSLMISKASGISLMAHSSKTPKAMFSIINSPLKLKTMFLGTPSNKSKLIKS